MDSAYFVDEFEIDMEVILSVLDAIVNPTKFNNIYLIK